MSYKELVSLFCPIKNTEIAMFALAKWVQGRSPCKKDDVILRARPQTILRPKDLVPRPFTSAARCLYGVV